MKVVYRNLLLAAALAFSSAQAMAQTSQKEAPSYDDTVHYIQERLNSGLEQQSRCHFVHHWGGDSSFFNAADLSPHVSWGHENQDGELMGSINCAGGANCVRDFVVLYSDGRGKESKADSWSFQIKKDTDKSKMEKALLHLLDLCGVRPAKPDLF